MAVDRPSPSGQPINTITYNTRTPSSGPLNIPPGVETFDLAEQDSIPYEDEEANNDNTRDYNSPIRNEQPEPTHSNEQTPATDTPTPLLPIPSNENEDIEEEPEPSLAINSPDHKKPKKDEDENQDGGGSSSSAANGIHLANTYRPKVLQNFQAFNDQQINVEHLQQRHHFHMDIKPEELHEYQHLMADMAAEVTRNLHFMESGDLPWNASGVHWVIPGAWKQSRAFYFDLETGEAIFAQSDDVLTEEEIYQNWEQVDEADRQESRSFIDNECFKARHTNQMGNNNVIDGTWVRRWKKTYDKQNKVIWIIKSRMCGRGFLDSQKNSVMRHSSTASRLSQPLVASFMATSEDFEMET